MNKKEDKPVFVCNKPCEFMRHIPALFPDIEIVECSNKVYRTLNIIPTGGGIEV